jgi:hypothetical protein
MRTHSSSKIMIGDIMVNVENFHPHKHAFLQILFMHIYMK